MSDALAPDHSTQPPDDSGRHIDAICDRFEQNWRAGRQLRIEDYLDEVDDSDRPRLLAELVAVEIELRRSAGETFSSDEYQARFPELSSDWRARFNRTRRNVVSDHAANPPNHPRVSPTSLAGRTIRIRCPHCHNPIQLVDDKSDEVLCPGCGSSFTVRDARHTDTTSHSRALGKYHLLERVGLGAFGAVWKARDMELDRIVALKIPHTGLVTNDTELQRFHREARAAAQLRHPGIVSVHSVKTLDGLPTIVSDFISGYPLKDLIQDRQLTFRESAALVADVAEAVHYAHTLGVVHRDLKPANIMIETGEHTVVSDERSQQNSSLCPRVMDFGLALRGEAEVTMTLDGHILGTPAYMSPEQAAGRAHEADAKSDVYSLGVILYETLTGELPFRGTRAMMLAKVIHDEPIPLRKVNDKIPCDLETVCLKCLRKEPERRYQTASELAEDLRCWLNREPVSARPVGRLERGWRWCRRNPGVATLAAAAVLALTSGTGVSMHFAIREAQAAEAEKRKTKEALEHAERADRETENAKRNAQRADKQAEQARNACRKSDHLLYVTDMLSIKQAADDSRVSGKLKILQKYDSGKNDADDPRGYE